MKLHRSGSHPHLEVRLFTRPGCHLCEQAQADLARLHRRYPHTLQLIDVTAAPELQQAYGERIPVLAVAGREYSAPLAYAEIERAVAEATSSLVATQESGPDAS